MITKEMESEILRDYNDRNITMRELENKYHIHRAEIAWFAVEHGANPRRPQMYGKKLGKRTKATICPKCKKSIDVKGAKFCCFCGEDMRSAKDLLIERINKAMNLIAVFPSSARDEMQQLFIDTIKELEG